MINWKVFLYALMGEMGMRVFILVCMIELYSMSASAACTGLVKITQLWPRQDGWVHIQAEGVADIDISNCGVHSSIGMLLNFNDATGTAEGKKMLYSTLLAAFAAGKKMELCSDGCDTQHNTYTRLSYINKLQ